VGQGRAFETEAEVTPKAADLSDDPEELRGAICDLVAISTLPTIWIEDDVQRIAESVAEVLVAMLGLEFVFVSLLREGQMRLQAARSQHALGPDRTARIGGVVAGWLIEPPFDRTVTLANPVGSGTVQVLFQTIGIGRHGVIAAGSCRPDFPTAVQRLLLGVAANQAAIAIERRQSAHALRQLNETLEQRVAGEIAERLKLEEAFRQAQKMEAIGQLTGGVAHDFNNLLTAIWGSLEMLERHVTSPQGCKLLQTATRAAHRGAELTEKLLAFSRKQHLIPQAVDLNQLAIDGRDMVERSVGPNVHVEMALAPELWPALVDPVQIELAILNLAINSRDAMPRGGRLTIRTRNAIIPVMGAPADLAPGDYVAIAVADTGTGIAPEVLDRVLDPFFTTKDVGKGSGLGLSMVYGVVKQSGGSLRIDTALGSGTTIELLLPRA
jgi:signal transduction histidine kinase